MPAITIELPDWLKRIFPEYPRRFFCLVIQREGLADQMAMDAQMIERIMERLERAKAAVDADSEFSDEATRIMR